MMRDFVLAADPAAYMGEAGYMPDPWQRDFVRSTDRRSLLMCSRQSGKSTVTASLASHAGAYRPGALVLLFAPSQQQSRELYRKVVAFHREATDLDPEAESAQRLELPNGSRIVSLSGNPQTARGFSGPDLIIIDEAAFIDDELYHAITPMLAAGGRLIAMTTPYGRRGWFHDAWTGADPAWTRTMVTADQSPRITAEFLETERAAKPHWRFRQEYFCEFVDTEDQVFGSDYIAAALSPAVAPLFQQPFTW